MSCVLGIDGGTESLRSRVFDLSGRCLASASAPYDTTFSSGARAEQDPEAWWQALGLAVRQSIVLSGQSPDAVLGLALATTSCSVVALDEDGRALRPAIIWMDVRAGAEADAVLATGDAALEANGAGLGPVSAEWMIPKALWIARHEPEIFRSARTICEYQDVMNLRLTGRRSASLNNASIRWHYSRARGGWPSGLVRSLGLEPLLDKWPAEVIAPGQPDRHAHAGRVAPSRPADLDDRRPGRRRCADRAGRSRRRPAGRPRADHRFLAPAVRHLRPGVHVPRSLGHLSGRPLSRPPHHRGRPDLDRLDHQLAPPPRRRGRSTSLR